MKKKVKVTVQYSHSPQTPGKVYEFQNSDFRKSRTNRIFVGAPVGWALIHLPRQDPPCSHSLVLASGIYGPLLSICNMFRSGYENFSVGQEDVLVEF